MFHFFYLNVCLLHTFVDNGHFIADLDDCSNDKSINSIHSKDTCNHSQIIRKFVVAGVEPRDK